MRSPGVAAVALACLLDLVAPTSSRAAGATPPDVPQSPVTSFTMVGEPDDGITRGQEHMWFPGNSALTVNTAPQGIEMHADGGTSGSAGTIRVQAPAGKKLAVGDYDVQRSYFQDADHAGLDVGVTGGSSCNTVSGRIRVLDVADDGVHLTRLHLVYEERCDGDTASVFGEVRFQSPEPDGGLFTAPGYVRWPLLYPGVGGRTVPVRLVNTGGAPLAVGAATVQGADAQDFGVVGDDCPDSLTPGTSCEVDTRFTPSHAGAAQAVLSVATDAGTRTITLLGDGEPGHTGWDIGGDADDTVIGAHAYSWTPLTATFTAWGNQGNVELHVKDASHAFLARFQAGPGNVLVPGLTYTGAQRFPSSTSPGFELSGDGRSCDEFTASFTIREIVVDNTGLQSFSATFEQHCQNTPDADRGSVAWRATGLPGPVNTDSPSPTPSVSPSPTTAPGPNPTTTPTPTPTPTPKPTPTSEPPPTAPRRADVLAVTGTDGQVWVRASDAGDWTPYGGRLVGAPTYVRGRDVDYLVGVGGDANVWIRTASTGWRPLGPVGTRCGPASAAVSDRTLAVACRGSDGALWVASALTGAGTVPSLGSWSSLGGDVPMGAAVTDTSSAGRPAAFTYVAVGRDARVWLRTDSTGWRLRSAETCSGPVSASTSAQVLGCRAGGSESLKTFHTPSGHDGGRVPGRMVGVPAVTVDPDGVARYYVLGTDGSIWTAAQQSDGTLGSFSPFGGAGTGGLSGTSMTTLAAATSGTASR